MRAVLLYLVFCLHVMPSAFTTLTPSPVLRKDGFAGAGLKTSLRSLQKVPQLCKTPHRMRPPQVFSPSMSQTEGIGECQARDSRRAPPAPHVPAETLGVDSPQLSPGGAAPRPSRFTDPERRWRLGCGAVPRRDAPGQLERGREGPGRAAAAAPGPAGADSPSATWQALRSCPCGGRLASFSARIFSRARDTNMLLVRASCSRPGGCMAAGPGPPGSCAASPPSAAAAAPQPRRRHLGAVT